MTSPARFGILPALGSFMLAWVYILSCADGRFYVGSYRGEDPGVREAQHNAGADPKAWTYARRPVVLVWATHFDRITDAIAFERQLKGWTRAKKLAVIRGDWSALPDLARCHARARAPDGLGPRPSTDGDPDDAGSPAQDEGLVPPPPAEPSS